MFSYIKGALVETTVTHVVLENSNIGYKIFISVNTFHELPQIGEQVTLHTAFVVRELSQTLYGFLSSQARDFFEILMGVTGIGPKLALAIIGHLALSELYESIANGDTVTLCRIPGIGKKSAERLIIELRDKVNAMVITPVKYLLHVADDPKLRTINDAMGALMNLGYNQHIAQKAIKRSLSESPELNDLSSLIATSLKHV